MAAPVWKVQQPYHFTDLRNNIMFFFARMQALKAFGSLFTCGTRLERSIETTDHSSSAAACGGYDRRGSIPRIELLNGTRISLLGSRAGH